MIRSDRRVIAILAATLFASYAYFYQAGGWNQNSRFALIRAIIERSTVRIDAYSLHTHDRALWQGHYYSDKAPGQALFALPAVGIARLISRAVGVNPEGFPGLAWTSYVAGVVTSGLFTIVAALLVFWLSRRWGASLDAAIVATVAYGLATPAWAYATIFIGHAPAAGCLMIAFAAAVAMDDPDVRVRRKLAWLLGLSGSWAVVTDFPSAIPAIFIGVMALLRLRSSSRNDLIGVIIWIGAGVVIAAVPLFVYNTLAFGSPLHLGYESEEGFEKLRTGFFGITAPRLPVVGQLLFGSYRGLLPIAPILAAAPIGLWLVGRKRPARAPAIVTALIGLYYLTLNSSYYYWEGGWFYGPRHLVPALPFVCLGIAPLWDRAAAAWRGVLGAAIVWGFAITLIAVATTPQPPSNLHSPVTELLWPAFRDGDLSLNHQTFVHGAADPDLLRGGKVPHAAWNLGQLAGLKKLWSLTPLCGVWLAGTILLIRTRRHAAEPRALSGS